MGYSAVTQLRQRVERLEHAETSSVQFGAEARDLANFPGTVNLVAGANISLTPSTGTLTIAVDGAAGSTYGTASVSLSADTTWFDTGASATLPKGTYLIAMAVHGQMTITAGTGVITSRLYNVTDAAAIANTECLVTSSNVAGAYRATGASMIAITLGATKTIRIEAQRASGGTYSSASTQSNSTGRTSLTCSRLY